MSIMEKMMGWMIDKMKPAEKERMMEKMMEKFFAGMTKEEKQNIMEKMMTKMIGSVDISEMMPKMMSKMMKGMDMSQMMPQMMSQMMKGMMGTEKEGGTVERPYMPVMETQEDFKPWEFCPCRKLCEKAFKSSKNE